MWEGALGQPLTNADSRPLVFEGHEHGNLILIWRLHLVVFLPVGTVIGGGYTGNISTSRMMWAKDACVFPIGQPLNLWSRRVHGVRGRVE